jgi:putative ABC transport system substrate-binding protein
MSAFGPQRRFAAMQHDVGNRGQTGRSADEARTAALDPEPTWAAYFCCDAQHSSRNDVVRCSRWPTGEPMRRREFITLLGGAAAWPLAARAQQLRRIGILMTVQEGDPATQVWLAGFKRRLSELGWTEDINVRFLRRWAGGDPERIRANVAEIIDLGPDVILAQNTPMVAALRRQTKSVPIVFVQVSDPVGDGFVEALPRPGGNVTGFTNTMSSLGGKWLELLHEIAPSISRVGFLFNRAVSPGGGAYYMGPFQSAATALRVTTVPVEVRNESEIDAVIAAFARAGGDSIVAESDSFITVHRDLIIAATGRNRLPAIYSAAFFPAAGGLLSYGTDPEPQWQAAAGYIDRILKGEKPADLPVQQPTKFQLVINLKTAKALGLAVPLALLTRADEVIE